jgi:hypothetical protein
MNGPPPPCVRIRRRRRRPPDGRHKGLGRWHRDANAGAGGKLARPGRRRRYRRGRLRAPPKPAHDQVEQPHQQEDDEEDELFHAPPYPRGAGGVCGSPGSAIDSRIAVSACTFFIL